MDLFQAMRVFVATSDAGTMTAAARKLGLSKALVSRTIGDLEDHLHARLFTRTTRQMSLTEAGARYLEYSRDALDRNEDIECHLAEVAQRASGVLRVAAPVSYGALTLAPILPQFLAENPEVRLELDMSDRFIDIVDAGADLAIRIGTEAPESAMARRIDQTEHLLVAAPSLVAQHGMPSLLDDLLSWPRVVYPARPGPKPLESQRRTDQRPPVASVNSGEMLRELAQAGMGYTYLPAFFVERAIAEGQLVRLWDESFDPVPVTALWPHRKHMSFKARRFVDFLVGAIGVKNP